jgi:hypothetical protein
MKRWCEEFIIRQQLADELQMSNYWNNSLGHLIQIITKCTSADKAFLYQQDGRRGWSRSRLESQLENNIDGKDAVSICPRQFEIFEFIRTDGKERLLDWSCLNRILLSCSEFPNN